MNTFVESGFIYKSIYSDSYEICLRCCAIRLFHSQDCCGHDISVRFNTLGQENLSKFEYLYMNHLQFKMKDAWDIL